MNENMNDNMNDKKVLPTNFDMTVEAITKLNQEEKKHGNKHGKNAININSLDVISEYDNTDGNKNVILSQDEMKKYINVIKTPAPDFNDISQWSKEMIARMEVVKRDNKENPFKGVMVDGSL